MRPAAFLLSAILLSPIGLAARAQDLSAVVQKNQQHDTEEWRNISEHLPDLATASVTRLEQAADVLRARRYDGDALIFYSAALQRGGDPHAILKKMGIACLELQQPTLAKIYFQRSVRVNRKDPVAWNDLGAADFVLQNNHRAIGDYKHAIKLNRDSAVFHSNLALAYFDTSNVDGARRELGTALRLDPDLLQRRDSGGYSAQILATAHYGEICFEMARIYASQGDVAAMLDWLTKASERGFDVHAAMDRDATLRPMLADPRVQVLIKNSRVLRAGNKRPANVPSLGGAAK